MPCGLEPNPFASGCAPSASAHTRRTPRQPGKPQRNAYVERYNRTVRQGWLGLYLFETIEEAQQIATEWLWTYKHE
jgi:transposase InsO family protein